MKNNDKKDRFQDLAESRLTKTISMLRLIGNLSNKRVYNYTESQKIQILRALDKELKDLKHKFDSSTSHGEKKVFKFDDE